MLLAVVKVKTHPLQTTVNIYLLKPPWPKPLHSYEILILAVIYLPTQSKNAV